MIRTFCGLRHLNAALRRTANVRGRAFSTADLDYESDEAPSELGLNADILAFKEVAKDFATNEFLPNAAKWDEEKHFPVDVLRRAADLGFGGIYCSEDVGGSGLGRQAAASIFETLAYADVSTTAYLTIHNMNCFIVDTFGTEEQRQRILPAMTCMERLSSYCLTEPGSGSDAASLITSARRDPGSTDYILNGAKAFISGAGHTHNYFIMARTGEPGPKGISCFLVEAEMDGVVIGANENKLGWNSQPTASVTLEEVRVPERNLIGGEGNGFKIAMTALDGGRINIATCSVGGAQFCLDAARDYTAGRKQFNKSIDSFQHTQFKLADMATSVLASRLMVRNAAHSLDHGLASKTMHAATAKRFATDTCYQVCNDALQMFGGYGYLKDYPVERYVRDLRVHTILEGTNEVMRMIIARELMADK